MAHAHEDTTLEADQISRLQRRLARERRARLEAESIAERGLRDLYQKRQEIQLLESIAVAANEAPSVPHALQLAVDRICEHTGWPLGHVYMCDAGSGGALRPSGIWHMASAERFEGFRRDTERTWLAAGTGLPGRVMASGQPAWIGDVTTDLNFPRAEAARQVGVHAAFAFPVLAGSDVAGVLEFFLDAPSAPDEALLRIMRHVGTQLGRVVERVRAQERLIHDALHDPLTRLPNRVLFLERLQRAFTRRKRHPEFLFAVLFVDLDRFKMVNDSLGHAAGDELLIEIARRLTAALRRDDCVARPAGEDAAQPLGDDTLARLGGDEFTILLDDIKDPMDAVKVAARIDAALQMPVRLGRQDVFVTASVGIATSTDDYESGDGLVRDADIAMYRAKALGRGRCAIFDRTMQEQAVARLELETELRHAIDRQEFRLHYQPIVDLATRRIVGFEALVRWNHPGRGLLTPSAFMAIAEETGMIVWIDRWVLGEACRTAREWHRSSAEDTDGVFSVSVNVSARQFSQSDFVRLVADVLTETQINPAALRLEITESAVMTNAEHAAGILGQLKALGVRLSLDDFGTGYSSLSYLRRFPVDTLKIDQSFIREMDADDENRQIVRAILDLGKSLGLEVIAEGTETAHQVGELEALQCRFAQGYFFAKPMPLDADTLRHLLAHRGDDGSRGFSSDVLRTTRV